MCGVLTRPSVRRLWELELGSGMVGDGIAIRDGGRERLAELAAALGLAS